jgi:hypothetical protein
MPAGPPSRNPREWTRYSRNSSAVGRSPRAAPYMHHAHDAGAVVDRKEDAVHVRLPPVAEYSNRAARVDALGCHRTPIGMLNEGQNSPLEAVEPGRTLLRSPLDDPQVQLLELGFRVPREINAVCHACDAAD